MLGKEAGTFRKVESRSSATLKTLNALRSSLLYFQLQKRCLISISRNQLRVMGASFVVRKKLCVRFLSTLRDETYELAGEEGGRNFY